MKILHRTYRYIPLVLAVFCLNSCLKDLDIEPIDPLVIQTFKQNEVFAKVYASWSLSGQQGPAGSGDLEGIDEGRFSLTRSLWNCNELPTDEAICAWGDIEVTPLNRGDFTSTNPSFMALYSRLFFVVTISNHFLEQTEGKEDEESVKQRAEVRFNRALAYSYLMDLFGNVPFITVVSDEAPQQIKRADLFVWVEKELKEIEPQLYDVKAAPYYRIDKAGAWLLLARNYLNAEVYTGTARWDEAAQYAKKVMDSNYKLAGKYRYLFMADNGGAIDQSSVNDAPNEIIFPISVDGVKSKAYGHTTFLINSTRTSGMPAWGTTSGWGGNRARATLVKKFFPHGNIPSADLLTEAANDDRALLTSTDRTLNISDPTKFAEGFSVVKYNNLRADGGKTSAEDFPDTDIPFMRAAEAYLTYAEAVVRGAAPIGMTALEAVNIVRERSNATALLDLDQKVLIDEWAREFFFEGRRRSDLIRFKQFSGNDYLWDWKGGVPGGTAISANANLFPIPADDLNANGNLEQNPGY